MKTLSLILCLCFSLSGTAQELNYLIKTGDTEVGKLQVSRSQGDNHFEITVNSEVRVKLFMHINLRYKLISRYKNDELISSSVVTFVNDREHSKNLVEKNGNSYSINTDGDISKFSNIIHFSEALLYYKEPSSIAQVFSEFIGEGKPCKQIQPHVYQTINQENGHISQYHYENGVLQKATVHNAFLTFEIMKQ